MSFKEGYREYFKKQAKEAFLKWYEMPNPCMLFIGKAQAKISTKWPAMKGRKRKKTNLVNKFQKSPSLHPKSQAYF